MVYEAWHAFVLMPSAQRSNTAVCHFLKVMEVRETGGVIRVKRGVCVLGAEGVDGLCASVWAHKPSTKRTHGLGRRSVPTTKVIEVQWLGTFFCRAGHFGFC